MELGSQDIQELTGYIEEMFSEYMTFPTILFIVAIVVALSSIACFILAPFYIKGKARGAKTAAQVISVIDFIIGILLILAFIIITLLFNMASDGFFDSADEFLKAVLGFLIAPTRFGMSPLSVFGSEGRYRHAHFVLCLVFCYGRLARTGRIYRKLYSKRKIQRRKRSYKRCSRTCGSTSV